MNDEGESNNQTHEKEPVRALVRAFCLIEALARDNGQPKGIQELCHLTGLTKATVHRLINTLVDIGYAEKDFNGKYCLGLKLMTLSGVILSNLHVANVAKHELDQLAKKTQLTAHLGILDNNDLLYVEKANSNQSIQTSSYVGQRSYVHSTSLGKAICAHLPVETVKQILNEKGMPKFTEKTLITVESFLAELKKIKQNGYAVDNEENEKYVRCVAAPIFDHTSSVIASISVSGLIIHIPEEKFCELSNEVMIVAKKISRKMGYLQQDF
jgi:IclR family acetate operon transcriptional repressor